MRISHPMDFLKSISSQSSIEAIQNKINSKAFKAVQTKLKTLHQKVQSEVPLSDELNHNFGELASELHDAYSQLDLALNQLERFERALDVVLPSWLSLLETSIFNFKTATDAVSIYNEQWFKGLLLSESAKVELASKLLSLVSRYTKYNIELLEKIAERNPKTISYIMSPYDNV